MILDVGVGGHRRSARRHPSGTRVGGAPHLRAPSGGPSALTTRARPLPREKTRGTTGVVVPRQGTVAEEEHRDVTTRRKLSVVPIAGVFAIRDNRHAEDQQVRSAME